MKKIKQILIFIFGMLVLSGYSIANATPSEIPDEVIEALKMGNSKKLAKYFNQNLELVILEDGGFYTEKQAEILVDDFFAKNKPNSFQVVHSGNQSNASFIIGRMKCYSDYVFRVYVLMRKFNGEFVITQLKIEIE